MPAGGSPSLSADGTYVERPEFRPATRFERRGARLGHGSVGFGLHQSQVDLRARSLPAHTIEIILMLPFDQSCCFAQKFFVACNAH